MFGARTSTVDDVRAADWRFGVQRHSVHAFLSSYAHSGSPLLHASSEPEHCGRDA